MMQPTMMRMILAADSVVGGYGFVEGTKVVVCTVVIVFGSGMFFSFFFPFFFWRGRGVGRGTGEGQGKLDGFRQRSDIFLSPFF